MITTIITFITISTIIATITHTARSVQTSGGGGEYLQCSTLVGMAGHEGNSMQEMFLIKILLIIIRKKHRMMVDFYI